MTSSAREFADEIYTLLFTSADRRAGFEKFVSDLKSRDAEIARKAGNIIRNRISTYPNTGDGVIGVLDDLRIEVESLITVEAANTLEEHDRQVALKEAEWWFENAEDHAFTDPADSFTHCKSCERLAALRSPKGWTAQEDENSRIAKKTIAKMRESKMTAPDSGPQDTSIREERRK